MLAAVALVIALPAIGAETQWWVNDSASDYAKAESHGVAVRPDGSLEPGPEAESFAAESLSTVWAIAVLKDGSVAIAGDHGRIDRWTERGGIKPWVKLPAGQVLSLAADGEGVIAGTGPEGLIYRVGARGDTTRLAKTGERYVWGLVSAGNGAWWAATGTKGRLLRVSGGKVETVFDSDESNLVSLIADGSGGVYTGGDSKGRLFRVSRTGATRTIYDAAEDEIRAIALGSDGAVYAAGLTTSAVTGDDDDETPTPAKAPAPGGRAVVYRIVPDSVAAAYWTSPQPSIYALATGRDGVVAATGNRAAVYRIERPEGATVWLAVPQGQVTALAVSGNRMFAATSNPGALWRIGPGRADRGELLSGSFDARRVARFGRLRWHGESNGGRVELSARSGNSDPPDTTWSPWKGGPSDEDGIRLETPPARYLQWRIVLRGGTPHVTTVETSWREQNLPPRVDEVSITPQGRDVREGEIVPRSEPITQTLPGGQRVEYSITPQPNPRQLREIPVWARGLRSAQWKGSDPNGDPLRYRVELQSEGSEAWIKLADDLEATAWTFDTHAFPDGRYRLRVVATDKLGNPVGEERTGEGVSAPFTVDNTPPQVTSLDAKPERGSIRVTARAEDQGSTLSRVEVSIDDDDWQPVTPTNGFADERRLSIDTVLRSVPSGEHTVGVRAVDAAGNAATRAQRVSVPANR
jgi:hypothetical protein